jgi:hypothetical protein
MREKKYTSGPVKGWATTKRPAPGTRTPGKKKEIRRRDQKKMSG